MAAPTPIRPFPRRAVRRALLVFTGVLALSSAALGSFLAVNPHLGGYVFTRVRPYAAGTRPQSRSLATFLYYRDEHGVHHAALSKDPPAGTRVLGQADFEIACIATGHPRPYLVDWTFEVSNIEPRPGAPPADDATAWRRLVGEAVSKLRAPSPWARPRKELRSGAASGRSLDFGAFAYDASYRLLHAPLWSAACLLMAGASAVLVLREPMRAHRRGRLGRCACCGYDRAGLAPSAACPECGASAL